MSEKLTGQENSERREPTKYTIDELLPRYYETHGEGIRYEIERSIPIEGHEVAWMRFDGTRHDGSEFNGHAFKCACDFEEGTGWRVDEKYGVVGISGGEKCLPKKAALYLRQEELKAEYMEQFPEDARWGDNLALLDHVPEVVMDLIEKDKRGEFIGEETGGAHFWGGHMYMQTVAEITGKSMRDLWGDMDNMQRAKQISLEGCVIQEYRQPPEPKWSEYGRFEYEGYTGIAHLPNHSKMSQVWQISVLGPDGNLIAESIQGPALTHDSTFGADVDDVAAVELAVQETIEQFIWDPMSQA
jgi:hypothetical protein